jgi:hypothetical protein
MSLRFFGLEKLIMGGLGRTFLRSGFTLTAYVQCWLRIEEIFPILLS